MITIKQSKKGLWQNNKQQPYNAAYIIFITEDGVHMGTYDASDNAECPYLDTHRGEQLPPAQIKEWCYLDDLIKAAERAGSDVLSRQ